MRTLRAWVLAFVVLCLAFVPWLSAEEAALAWVPVAMHVCSTISDGSLTLEEIVAVARSKGLRAVFVNERDAMKWEYGVWPLRRFLKRTQESNSVRRYGAKRYLEYVSKVGRANPDVAVIPGLEVAPYYRWEGVPFTKGFKICDWHKHILAYGLDDPQDIETLPTLANIHRLGRPFAMKDLVRLWPFLVLVFGLWAYGRRLCDYRDDRGVQWGACSWRWRAIGIASMFLAVFSVISENPFAPSAYDSYCRIFDSLPYQKTIDHVAKRGGTTFWAHPEARYLDDQQGVKVQTTEHVKDLYRTNGYTGFSVFYEGYEQIGRIGGDWDELLGEYCRGERSHPVWAVGGLAFDQGTAQDLAFLMDDLKIWLLSEKATPDALIEALRHGRAVVSRGRAEPVFMLEEFSVEDTASGARATMGGELSFLGTPRIRVRGRLEADPSSGAPVEIRLIRNGLLLGTFSGSDVVHLDASPGAVFAKGGRGYYRLEIRNKGQLLVTNPIFVTKA